MNEYTFKVKDTVRISKDSKYYSDLDNTQPDCPNPRNCSGVISSISTKSNYLNISVLWTNGTTNSYSACDLILYNEKSLENLGIQIIKRSDLRDINNVVCRKWQEKIATLVSNSDMFDETIEVANDLLADAYKEATLVQEELLNKYFTKPKDERIKASDLKIGEMMIVKESDPKSSYNGLILLKTFSNFVCITNATKTWSSACDLLGIKIEKGTKFEIIAK
jgi:hypothetical protein